MGLQKSMKFLLRFTSNLPYWQIQSQYLLLYNKLVPQLLMCFLSRLSLFRRKLSISYWEWPYNFIDGTICIEMSHWCRLSMAPSQYLSLRTVFGGSMERRETNPWIQLSLRQVCKMSTSSLTRLLRKWKWLNWSWTFSCWMPSNEDGPTSLPPLIGPHLSPHQPAEDQTASATFSCQRPCRDRPLWRHLCPGHP